MFGNVNSFLKILQNNAHIKCIILCIYVKTLQIELLWLLIIL
jgi:hypothetical protein